MLKIVKQADFVSTAWKNGGGITREALRKSREGGVGDFIWRVSVAHIDRSGPFSEFAGYRRSMVLLQGDGVRLSFSDRTVTELRAVGDLVNFDGALGADCELLGSPCIDLNLMVADGVAVQAATVEEIAAPVPMLIAPSTTVLVFCIDGAVTLDDQAHGTGVLERWDMAAVTPAAGALNLAPQSASLASTVFIARLID